VNAYEGKAGMVYLQVPNDDLLPCHHVSITRTLIWHLFILFINNQLAVFSTD